MRKSSPSHRGGASSGRPAAAKGASFTVAWSLAASCALLAGLLFALAVARIGAARTSTRESRAR